MTSPRLSSSGVGGAPVTGQEADERNARNAVRDALIAAGCPVCGLPPDEPLCDHMTRTLEQVFPDVRRG